MILNLSFQLLVNGRRLESVNNSSNKPLAKQEAMFELGNVIPRIIWTMALSNDTTTPFMFSKVNLKDGYWRMAVNEADAWNFAYVLPGAGPHEPIQLVIPDALQMSWSESSSFFCAATETARDIIDEKMRNNVILPEQPMENIMMAIDWTAVDKLPNQPAATECYQRKFLSLIEVYIDDFIGIIQSTNKAHLLQLSRRILDGITKVFPPRYSLEAKWPTQSRKRNYSRMAFGTPARKSLVGYSAEWHAQSSYRITNAPSSSLN
jgi:hypothetical protein